MDNAEIEKNMDSNVIQSVISAKNISKTYDGNPPVCAVTKVYFDVMPGEIFGLIGPDGAGKTSIIQILAGVADASSGSVKVAGFDPESQSDAVKNIIGYMPQGLGLNLYDSLSVEENINFFRDLRQIPHEVFEKNNQKMLAMTRLAPFFNRQAKDLSGGMRQKLSLICTLVHMPDILLLDEPTTGVDPRSREEFWEIILELVEERQVTVILSTSYMDEAARCQRVALLHHGEIIQQGTPKKLLSMLMGEMINCLAQPQYEALINLQAWDGAAEPQVFGKYIQMRLIADVPALKTRLKTVNISCTEVKKIASTLDDVFVQLAGKSGAAASMPFVKRTDATEETMVNCQNVTIRFEKFTAVNDITCQVKRGEVFGLLGPNGAGKTTLIKSMCGLLQPTIGKIRIAGYETDKQRQQVWSQIGYMSQRFSLYRDLTVLENLNLYAGLYNVEAVNFDLILQTLGLSEQSSHLSGNLPIGIRQRLSLVCAILHEPPVIFLDEPTSGVDPVARRDFWNIIHQLTRKMGKTVLVSTHYMDEAERCDRLILMDQGHLVALDSPEYLKQEAARNYGGKIVIMTDEPKRAYSLVKKIFSKATMFGQDVHLRSMDVEGDSAILLRELASAKLEKLSIVSAPISMGDAFMDWINHAAVSHV